MVIEYKRGNLFDSGADVLVNTVNCVGVSGRGLALQFKEKFPWPQKVYETHCKVKTLKPGHLLFSPTKEGFVDPPWVCHFATKDHWRDPSKLEWIESGLRSLQDYLLSVSDKVTVALPPVGCGLGGLNWEKQVRPLVIKYLSSLPNKILMYGEAPING